jgi:uncharacterized protein
MEFSGFDWDRGNRDKCQKHGVSVREIESLFSGVVMVNPDPTHSGQEERFKAIGTTARGRKVLLGETLLRPISARYMHQKEVAYYEQKITPDPEK